MQRRTFLALGGAAALGGALGLPARAATDRRAPSTAGGATEVDALVRDLVRANDAALPALLARQERRPDHRWRGGVPNEFQVHGARHTAHFVEALACAWSARDSRYFHSAELVEPLRLAVRYLRAAQHDDGTTDLPETNFHSPPDTAFCLEVLCPAYRLLRDSGEAALDAVAAELAIFIRKAGDALATGGVHTPNHRWVVCGGLASINALFPEPRLVARIDQWLAEGIDLDPDGQFTEKSTSVYSPTVDRALLTVARHLERPGLREAVRRNLEMTLYYVHPDGEVVTEASRRQDRYQRGSMARYYYAYRVLALHDHDGRFAAMARQIERVARAQLGSELIAFLTEPELRLPLPSDAPLPTDYEKVFRYSNLARIRRGAVSGTILAGNTTLFSLRKGVAALEAVRLASAFFGKGQFTSEDLVVRDGAYVLRQTLDGPYFQPLTPEQIATGDFVRMAPNGTLLADNRAARVRSNIQHLESRVIVSEKNGTFTLAISLHGTADVPVALELAFRAGGTLRGVEPVAGIKDAFLLSGAGGSYAVGDDTITFGPGRAEHRYTQLRGALPKWEGQSVYLTGFTPFDLTLTLA
jgi:hypothetical protein